MHEATRSTESPASLYERQFELAKQDIDHLYDWERDLDGRQSSLLRWSVGLILTTFALAISALQLPILSSNADTVIVVLASVLLMVPLISLPYAGVYIQTFATMRKAAVFRLLLQQCIALGHFPESYRGWEDANANYMALVKAKQIPPLRPINSGTQSVERLLGARQEIHKLFVSRISHVVAVMTFLAVPTSSLFISLALFLTRTGQARIGPITGAVLAVCVMIWVLIMRWYLQRLMCLLVGRLTYTHLQQLFAMILSSAPPYNCRRVDTDNWVVQFQPPAINFPPQDPSLLKEHTA